MPIAWCMHNTLPGAPGDKTETEVLDINLEKLMIQFGKN